MRTVTIQVVLVILLISGCAQASSERPPEDSAPSSEEIAQMSNTTLSDADQQALLSEIASQRNLAADQLTITAVQEADWPDACLGLAGPDEFCAQIITPGWAVSVSDGQNTWKYRTDLEMSRVKLEP